MSQIVAFFLALQHVNPSIEITLGLEMTFAAVMLYQLASSYKNKQLVSGLCEWLAKATNILTVAICAWTMIQTNITSIASRVNLLPGFILSFVPFAIGLANILLVSNTKFVVRELAGEETLAKVHASLVFAALIGLLIAVYKQPAVNTYNNFWVMLFTAAWMALSFVWTLYKWSNKPMKEISGLAAGIFVALMILTSVFMSWTPEPVKLLLTQYDAMALISIFVMGSSELHDYWMNESQKS